MFVAKPTERHWRDRAHTHIARALELDASHPSVHLWVGYALGSSGEAERALPYAEQAVRARPNIAIARQGLGQVYQMLDRNDESLAELTTAERLAPNAPGQFILSHHIAITLLRQHAFAAALERLDEAIRLLRNFADALYVRAMTLERLSRGEEALAEMRRAKASDLDLAGEARMIRQHSKYETWWWRNHEDLPLILATFQKLSDATEPGA
jgi:tetratricopeptide (TPR) repeat protein